MRRIFREKILNLMEKVVMFDQIEETLNCMSEKIKEAAKGTGLSILFVKNEVRISLIIKLIDEYAKCYQPEEILLFLENLTDEHKQALRNFQKKSLEQIFLEWEPKLERYIISATAIKEENHRRRN